MKAGRPPKAAVDKQSVAVAVRLTDAEAAAVDAARGTVTRSAWVRAVAVAKATTTPPG